MNLDANGLVVQKDGDGGDCLQRMGFWYEGIYLNKNYRMNFSVCPYTQALTLLCISGQYIRYPVKWNDPKDTSRDQLVSNIRAMGYYDFKEDLKNITWQIIKNWSRYPNNDLAFLQDYSRIARSMRAWWLYPLILLGDLLLLGNSIVRIFKGKNYDDVGDDINHIGDLAQSQYNLPTPVSWAARKIYVKFRPSFAMVAVGIVKANPPGALWALNWYFRPESGGNPEFADLWTPIVIGF